MKAHFGVTDLLWPLIQAIFSVAAYFLIVLLIRIVNYLVKSTLLTGIVDTLFGLLYVIFLLALVSSYANHFRKISGLSITVPFLLSLSITIIIYFLTRLFDDINKLVGAQFLTEITTFMQDKLVYIFLAIVGVSYIVALARAEQFRK